MKKILLLLCIILVSCGGTKTVYVPVQSVKTVTETLRDTIVQVKLDIIRDSIHVKDTISFLQNKYVESYAKWTNGELHHSLKMKDVSTNVKIIYKDRIERDTTRIPYPVEKQVFTNKLNWYQESCVWITSVLFGGVIIWIIIWLIKKKLGIFSK